MKLMDRLSDGEHLNSDVILEKHPELGEDVLRQLTLYIDLETTTAGDPPLGTLGDYTLRRQIGRGGMGVVYEAWENSMDRRVALKVLPAGMSVKDAAKRLGIGRPALSNFLNGNSALSPEMAVRLEKTFGADRKQLLDMQAAYDRQQEHASEKEVAVRAFVPSFLIIKARQIEEWADSQIEARNHLPVLLRKLVHSTGNELRKVDFPAYDNAQRKGSDGFIEAGASPRP